MTRLTKTEEIIRLIIMFQNSRYGICLDDIQEEFECSRRAAIRMKSLLVDLFDGKIEEVQRNEKKKYWRFNKDIASALISFNTDDFANLEYFKGLSNDKISKNT